MNHPFLTKRHELKECNEKICICDDILTLLKMKPDDHAKIIARRDEEIKEDKIRETVLRRACCLGLLVDNLNKYDGVSIPDNVRQVWPTFLLGTKVNTSSLHELVTTIHTNTQQLSTTLSEIEEDDNSSSYSDYSDSHTVSSDEEDVCKRPKQDLESEEEESEEEESEEESEEEESEESEEEASPIPIKKQRR